MQVSKFMHSVMTTRLKKNKDGCRGEWSERKYGKEVMTELGGTWSYGQPAFIFLTSCTVVVVH